jgi:hypothetical protein
VVDRPGAMLDVGMDERLGSVMERSPSEGDVREPASIPG